MPHMDGIEATMRIRAELPEIRILGLSMQPRSGVADAIEQAGAEAFFVKGLDTQRLIEHLLVVHASRGVGSPCRLTVGSRAAAAEARDAEADKIEGCTCSIHPCRVRVCPESPSGSP